MAPEPTVDAMNQPADADLAEAGVYQTEHDGFEHGLVVLAMGRPFWLMPGESTYRLLVEPPAVAAVREQLARFDRESIGWPPPPIETRSSRPADFESPLLWVLAVQAVFYVQGVWPGRLESIGEMDGRALFEHGEVWRPFTALFLHADLGHLLSNLVFGFFVFAALVSTVGRRRGWLVLAGAAYAGNVTAAALHAPAAYRSLGASTAVFAGLGLLTGRAVCAALRADSRHGWRGVFVPLASGLVLLALYGAGGADIDVVAHLTGFVAGLLLGLVVATPRSD